MHFFVGMKLFGATDEEFWKVITDTIDSSDYYVLIVGNHHDSIIENEGISFTDKGIPILSCIISDSVNPAVDKVDSEQGNRKKLVEFKQAVMTGRNIDQRSNPDELSKKVMAALYK